VASAPVVAPAVPVDVGYRDHDYGGGLAQAPTAEKPQSKIWHHDGSWWGCLWDPGHGAYRIHRLDTDTQTWDSPGPNADDRPTTLIDAKSDGARLYIVSHPYEGRSGSSRLYAYDYDAGSRAYSLRSGFPVVVNDDDAEALTIDKDSTGQLWIAWENGGTIWINRTISGDHDWGTPFALPVQGNSTSSDDVCAVAAFGDAIGVMWSNQDDQVAPSNNNFYFARVLDSSGKELLIYPFEKIGSEKVQKVLLLK